MGEPVAHVLIACPAAHHSVTVTRVFAEHGLAATHAFSGEQLLLFLESLSVDLVVLDPVVVTDVRVVGDRLARGRSAVLVLGDSEALGGTLLGSMHAVADRDLPPRELAARARAVLSLSSRRRQVDLSWGPLRLDLARRRAFWDGIPLHLTPLQFRILTALVRAEGAVVTRDELQHVVWPWSVPDDGQRLVAHIRRIRSKIEVDPSHPTFLLTARGEGFRLADTEPVLLRSVRS